MRGLASWEAVRVLCRDPWDTLLFQVQERDIRSTRPLLNSRPALRGEDVLTTVLIPGRGGAEVGQIICRVRSGHQ